MKYSTCRVQTRLFRQTIKVRWPLDPAIGDTTVDILLQGRSKSTSTGTSTDTGRTVAFQRGTSTIASEFPSLHLASLLRRLSSRYPSEAKKYAPNDVSS